MINKTVKENINKIKAQLELLTPYIPEYFQAELLRLLNQIELDAQDVAKNNPEAAINSLRPLNHMLEDLNSYFNKTQHQVVSKDQRYNDITNVVAGSLKSFNKTIKNVDRSHRYFRKCAVFLTTTFGAAIGAVAGVLAGVTALPILGGGVGGYLGYKFGKWLTSFSSRQRLHDGEINFRDELNGLLKQLEEPSSPLRFVKRLQATYHNELQLKPIPKSDDFLIELPDKNTANLLCTKMTALGLKDKNGELLTVTKNHIKIDAKTLKQFQVKFNGEQNQMDTLQSEFQKTLLKAARAFSGEIIVDRIELTATLSGITLTVNKETINPLSNLFKMFGIKHNINDDKVLLNNDEFAKLQTSLPAIQYTLNGLEHFKQNYSLTRLSQEKDNIVLKVSSFPLNNTHRTSLCTKLKEFGIESTISDGITEKQDVRISNDDFKKLLKQLAKQKLAAPDNTCGSSDDNWHFNNYGPQKTLATLKP